MSAKTEDWLLFAMNDLGAARSLSASGDAYPRQTGFLAQQAAEKAMKAVFVAGGQDFPFSHDLVLLYDLLPEVLRSRLDVGDLGVLTVFAVRTRCPTTSRTSRTTTRSTRSAADVLAAVEAHLAGR